jgi:lipocalin
MNLDIQFKINSNINYKRYLRENSNWYKILNRNPELFNDFVNEMKEKYKLRTTDKITDLVDKIQLIQMFVSALK